MKRILSIILLVLACRENTAPEARTTSTSPQPDPPAPVVETAGSTETTATDTAATATVDPEPIPSVHGPKLLPVDEASRDPEFLAYREELLRAVRSGNVEGVVALADPTIRTTFGAGGGAADFRRMLREPGMLRELEQVLILGGSFRGEGAQRSFWAPYVYSAWPDAHDPWETLAVISENVPLLRVPDRATVPDALLSYDLVERVSPPQPPAAAAPEPQFIEVATADERRGWVSSSSLRSHVGYRAGFMKVAGRWRMNAFVAGD